MNIYFCPHVIASWLLDLCSISKYYQTISLQFSYNCLQLYYFQIWYHYDKIEIIWTPLF